MRTVTKRICEKFPTTFLPGDKICDSRRKMSTVSEIPQEPVKLPDQSVNSPVKYLEHSFNSPDFSETESSTESITTSPVKEFEASVAAQAREHTNEYLRDMGLTPITKRKLQSRKYQKQKVEAITTMLQKAGISEKTSDEDEIVAQLKEKFVIANRSEKILILTVLPQSWSIRKIQSEFCASNFTVRKAKSLVAEHSILSTPNPKPGRSLPQTTRDVVVNFMIMMRTAG